MAKAGAKKRLEENRRRLQLLLYAIVTANAVHLLFSFLIFQAKYGALKWLGFALTSGIYVVCYSGLAKAAEPIYSQNGELEDGGANLSIGGMTGYYHDFIYLAVFVQLASLFSGYFWLIFLAVPAYALYYLWTGIIQPYIFTPRDEEVQESAAMQKRREKLERRQRRQQGR
ncbi:hypothetical protein WJX73_007441 [Symbiochloris irregularis]|uniref:Transmembrane protein 208 n=1 Tax=Symbiochloris irregularis TaxID=706552 RepID=A0AAW1PEH6_9CHLO